jgi:hypothetical protein
MRRREFITAAIGGLSLAHPVFAQQSGLVRRLGILTNVAEGDPVGISPPAMAAIV